MRAACGRAQMAIFGRREGSLAAGSPMLRVTEDEHGDAHGEHVEARISGASGSWCSWCRRGAHGGGLRGAGDAVVVMVNVAAGLRACRCPGRREMISPRGPLEVAGRHRRTTAGQAFQTTAATMPAPGTGRQGNWCCSLPGPAPGRNPNRLVHQVTDSVITSRARQHGPGQHHPAGCSRCRRAPNRTPATEPEPACSRRTSPTPLHMLRKSGVEQPTKTPDIARSSWGPGHALAHTL